LFFVEIDGDLKYELDEINRMNVELENLEKENQKEMEIQMQKDKDNLEVQANLKRQASIVKTRTRANNLQEKNSEKMVSNNEKLLGKASIGDIVVVFTIDFDRGIANPPNILCKVIDIDSHFIYQLACSVVILEKYVARIAFQIVSDTVDFSISRDKMVSPREAVRLLSLRNGQGFIYCECKTGTCKIRRCKCFANNLHCKSKCYSIVNSNCINKC
jgi:hypothetical protein